MREMKDSGISWIGVVPKAWDVKPIRALFEEVTKKNKHGEVKTALKFTYGEIVRKTDFDADDDSYVADTILNYTIVEPGTIILNGLNLNFDFVSQRIGLVKEKGVITSAYMAFRIKDTSYMLPEYATYTFKAYDSCKALHNMGGGVRKILNFQEFQRYYVFIPPLQEQQNIVLYLDRKCAEIDALTADIEAQIETLEQYKRSVITEAVTKGLDPDAEMKDSGVEWIDKIPSTWKESRIGYLSWLRARLGWKGLKADEYVDEGFPFLSAFNIQDSHVVWNNLNFISKERFDESPEIKLHIGDIILVKDGAGIGKCARIDSLPVGESTSNGSLAVITPYVDLEYRYLFYYFLSSVFQNYILRIMNGMGVPHLSQEELRKIVIPQPPVPIQKQIADYLDNKCAEIDSIIATKRTQLETLAEYKKSVIYEYVTGKKEVPNA